MSTSTHQQASIARKRDNRSALAIAAAIAGVFPFALPFRSDNGGTSRTTDRSVARYPGRYTHNPAGTKLAKRAAKGTLCINRRGW